MNKTKISALIELRDWMETGNEMKSKCECVVCVCACASHTVVSDCDSLNYSPPGSCVQGFSRQEYWSGLSFPPPGNLPDPEVKPMSAASQAVLYPLSHQGGWW